MPVSKRKLLLADDSITIQKVVNLTFADEGIEVITASDGDSAMQKFVENRPDLVMVDVNMPGMDGYRICELIKQDNDTKQIPVILLVGSFEPFDEEEARRVGADDYLTKPFQSIRQLVNKVSSLLGSEKEESSANVNFEPTDDYKKPDYEVSANNAFGDAGMDDDDIIQTNQVNNLPVEEEQKFAASPVSENPFDSLPKMQLKKPYDFGAKSLTEENDPQTQPFTAADFDEITLGAANTNTEKIFDFADKPSFSKRYIIEEPKPLAKKMTASETPSKPSFAEEKPHDAAEENTIVFPTARPTALLNFDDLNLLELPTFENENFSFEAEQDISTDMPDEITAPMPKISEILEKMPETMEAFSRQESEISGSNEMPDKQSATIPEAFNFPVTPPNSEKQSDVAEMSPFGETKTDEAQNYTETAENSVQSINFTPDLIEAIAAKVAEKISEIAVREITSKVTPQMVEMIIKQMAEEKRKE